MVAYGKNILKHKWITNRIDPKIKLHNYILDYIRESRTTLKFFQYT